MVTNQAIFNKAMTQGHNAAWDMEWGKAAAYYQQALQASPGNLQALTNLAAALFEMRDFENALLQYQQVVNLVPEDPIPVEKLSQIYEVLGNETLGANYAYQAAELYLKNQDVKKAIENWERCAYLSPGNLRARSRLAMTYEKQGNRENAIEEYLAVASLLQNTPNKDRALELVNRALALDPNNKGAKHALGLLRANQFLPTPARSPEQESTTPWLPAPIEVQQLSAPDYDDHDDGLPLNLSPVEEARRKALVSLAALVFDQAEEEVSKSSKQGRNAFSQNIGPLDIAHVEHSQIMLHLTKAVDAQTNGQVSDATESLNQAVEAGLDNAAAFFNLGLLRMGEGRLETALRHFQRSAQHPDFALGSRLLWGESLQDLGRYRDASIQYLEAMRLADSEMVDPEKADELRGLYEPLIEAHTEESNDDDANKKLCNSVQQMLMRNDWRDYIRQARKQLPVKSPLSPPMPIAELLTHAESSRVVELLANIYQWTEKGYFRIAMEEAYRALDYAPAYLHLHTVMGEMMLEEDKIQEAITKFNVVARAYSARGKSSRSIDLYRRITQLAPLDIPARYQLVDLLTASGQFEETVKEYLNLADVYYRLAELEKARETYQKALNIIQQAGLKTTWTTKILHYLADIDMQRLDWRRALRIFEQIRTVNPEDEKAISNIIDLNLRLGEYAKAFSEIGNTIAFLNDAGKAETAMALLNELRSNYPEQIAIHRLLAEQYEQMGKRADAIRTWDEVADQLLQQGDRAGAIDAVQAIIDMNPENVDEYRQALGQLING